MKKILIVVLALFATFVFIRIATSTYENIVRDTSAEPQIITADEAVELCYTVMGEQDEATGFPYSFGIVKTVTQDGKEYYAIRASWLVDNSHLSYIGDFFVSVDGTELYTGVMEGETHTFVDLIWEK